MSLVLSACIVLNNTIFLKLFPFFKNIFGMGTRKLSDITWTKKLHFLLSARYYVIHYCDSSFCSRNRLMGEEDGWISYSSVAGGAVVVVYCLLLFICRLQWFKTIYYQFLYCAEGSDIDELT